MEASERCLKKLKEFEGFRSHAYYCVGGKLTIGYGTTEGVKIGDTITEEEADLRLRAHVAGVVEFIKKTVLPKLNQNQIDALVLFVYNIGIGSFSKSTLLRKLNDGRFNTIPDEFRRWVYVNGQVSKHQVKRREYEANLFNSGVVNSK